MSTNAEKPTRWAPATVTAPTAPSKHPRHGAASRTWEYRNADGDVIGYVNRYETDEGKVFSPQIYDGAKWWWCTWPGESRPLYGLDRLAEAPGKWVCVCEGEKSADAAAALLPQYAVVSASGGKNALRYADWSVLVGRPGVLLWPDNDFPDPKKPDMKTGQQCFAELAAHLASIGIANIRIIDPSGMPEGWDAADATFDAAGLREWAKPRASSYDGPRVSPWAVAPSTERRPRPAPAPTPAAAAPTTPITEPYDILGKPLIPALKPEHLPKALREFVFDQSSIIGSDPGIIAIASLVAVAGCINDNIMLQGKREETGWVESARLWGAWIADPSSKKSPASGRAIKPLRQIDAALRIQSAATQKKGAIEKAIYRDALGKYIKDKSKQLLNGGSCGSPPLEPEEPLDLRLMVSDTTTEKLGIVMKDNPRGLIMNFDELSGLFGQMDAYKQGGTGGMDRAKYLELYNGGVQTVDRIGRESITVPNWSACIMGGIQPSSIRAIAHKLPEDGLMQRFMVVMAQDTGDIGEDRRASEEAVNRYATLLQTLHADNGPRRVLRMSQEAVNVLRRLETELLDVRKLGTASERVKAALGKYSGLFVRLCLTYHMANAVDARRDPFVEVSADTAWQVYEFMTGYLVGHLVAFYDDLLNDNGHAEHARAIGAMILARQLDAISNREVQRGYTPWGSLPDYRRAAAFRYLEDAGWLFPVSPDGGRRVVHYDVNPRVHELFYRTAEEERARRIAVVDQMRSSALVRAMQRTVKAA
jgi:hypothetical protein